jgi:CRISPR-associated protein Cas8b/Csh1 subtype I-B
MQRVRKLITGSRIALQPLLEQYVHQLVQDQRDQFDGDNEFIDFPKRSVVEQYTQLRALTAADVLHTADTSFTFDVATMSDSAITRDERLESFLDTHQALDEDHNRAVFLLGGLVGRITAYQDYNNVSSTLVRRYPVDYLTKQTIKEVTKEVLQVDNSYAEADDDRSYLTNNRYTSRLADTMLATDPSGWSMTEAELQWLYSLGISYGLNDISIDQDTGSDSATETTEADD